MFNNKRKSRRQPLRYAAWIVLGPSELQSCHLSDISDAGARINVDDPDALPDRFLLWLAGNGSARRTCHIVWRQKRQVGVRFERRLADAMRGALVPSSSAHRDAAAARDRATTKRKPALN